MQPQRNFLLMLSVFSFGLAKVLSGRAHVGKKCAKPKHYKPTITCLWRHRGELYAYTPQHDGFVECWSCADDGLCSHAGVRPMIWPYSSPACSPRRTRWRRTSCTQSSWWMWYEVHSLSQDICLELTELSVAFFWTQHSEKAMKAPILHPVLHLSYLFLKSRVNTLFPVLPAPPACLELDNNKTTSS